MIINIKTIPHDEQDYPTCGNWEIDDIGVINITVSETGDMRYNFLIALHEMIEAFLCKVRGISEESVTDFDVKFEKMRAEYPDIVGDNEPGDNVNAPYFNEHQFATEIESKLAVVLGVDWSTYDKTINQL
jgi:hypothetical protein